MVIMRNGTLVEEIVTSDDPELSAGSPDLIHDR